MNRARITQKFHVTEKYQIPIFKLQMYRVTSSIKVIISIVAVSLFTFSCDSPDVIKDLSEQSYPLLDQDSSRVSFPNDFQGNVTVVGFIYTNCPDVCSAITANMSNVNRQLGNKENVHFVGVTFDPKRDRPSVLNDYMQRFDLDEEQFTFVTGDTATVDSLLSAMDIVAKVSGRKKTDEGKELYFMNHTNRISLLDKQGRLRLEYSGSFSNPEQIIEGINKLR